MDLGGISCIVSDTAGLRADPQAADEIEREGIRRAGYVVISLLRCKVTLCILIF